MKKRVSLLLVLALLLGVAGAALADGDIPVTISIMQAEGDFFPKDGEPMPQELQDWFEVVKHLIPGYEINVKMEYFENPQEQLPLLLASGDIPDIVSVQGTTFMEYYNTGFFLTDLNDLLEKYGQDILNRCQEGSLEMCTINGKLVTIPSENYAYKNPTILRMDWVRKLGFEEKKTYTLSELKEILLAMAQKDPDGNGQDDTYGLGCRFNGGDWTQTFMPIFGAFGGQPNQTYLVDDVAVPFNYTDGFRACMEYLQELYAAKAIDQEAFILNYDQALLNAVNGKGGMYSGWWNVGSDLLEKGLLELQPDVDFQSIFVSSDDGTRYGVKDHGSFWKTALISAKCEHPEAAIAIINYCHTDEGATYGNPQLTDENGNLLYTGEPHTSANRLMKYMYGEPGQKLSNEEKYALGWRQHPLANLFYNLEIRQAESARSAAEYRDPANKIKMLADADVFDQALGIHLYQTMFYGYLATDEDLEYNAGLETLMKDWVVNFVTGAVEINDTTWQQYLDDAVSKGAQKVLDSYVAAYNQRSPEAQITAWHINRK